MSNTIFSRLFTNPMAMADPELSDLGHEGLS